MLVALASALAAFGRSDAGVGQDEGSRGVRSQAGQDALRAVCDLKKPIGVSTLALGSPKRLEVALSSELGPSTLGWTEPRMTNSREWQRSLSVFPTLVRSGMNDL